MWRFIFSSLFCISIFAAFGQDQEVPLKPKPVWKPHEIKIGFNAIRSGRTVFGSDILTHEMQVALAMHLLNIIIDLGIEENTHGKTYTYENRGSYFRVGGDWNFVKSKKSGNAISLGLRYARAEFKDQLDYTGDQGFGILDYDFENANLKARWAEVTFNLRGKVVSNFYMGFTARWQLIRKINGEGQLETFDIPGFGNTKRRNSTAFDYYLMWRIPLLKQ
ncbi:MAG: hypothetical protein GDA37_06250 [Ekhidna sp.]|nr:hypothetical protein [Ekhidna sp.]